MTRMRARMTPKSLSEKRKNIRKNFPLSSLIGSQKNQSYHTWENISEPDTMLQSMHRKTYYSSKNEKAQINMSKLNATPIVLLISKVSYHVWMGIWFGIRRSAYLHKSILCIRLHATTLFPKSEKCIEWNIFLICGKNKNRNVEVVEKGDKWCVCIHRGEYIEGGRE